MAKKNRGPRPPVVNVSTTTNVNAWDSAAFAKLLSEQAKANETAIKQLESSMAQAGANQQMLAEQIAQSTMMKDIKEALIAQLQDKQFTEAKKEAIKESLGFASKAAGIAPNKPIVEVNDTVSRWQMLAGIK